MAYVESRLRRIGVLGALEAEGFQPGRRDRDRGRDARAGPRVIASVGAHGSLAPASALLAGK